jgi:putative flippase GtrA
VVNLVVGGGAQGMSTPHIGMRGLVVHATRYGLAGVVVFASYVGVTLLLAGPAGLPIQLVIPFSLAIAGAVHFMLQRRFVFADRDTFALTGGAQARRYVVIIAIQYAFTAAATAVLPGVLAVSEQVVYVGAVCIVSATTFLFMRARVFHMG